MVRNITQYKDHREYYWVKVKQDYFPFKSKVEAMGYASKILNSYSQVTIIARGKK